MLSRPRSLLYLSLVSAALAGLTACGEPARESSEPASAPPASSTGSPSATTVDRGRFIVEIGGCHDCHTPKKLGPNGPEPDMSRMLSGHPETLAVTTRFQPAGATWTAATNDMLTAWSGPWGVSFAINLTPDPNTGLRSGVWTEALFIQAMRTGKHMGTARPILPPMPWQALGRLSDEDLKAVWEYLGTVPPIVNHVPDAMPPAGAN
ncbi:MAG: diheme cytochrome c-553 [Vicinamibacterales bacterium]